MTTAFPAGIDAFTTKVDRGVVYHTDINNLQDAVMALETFVQAGGGVRFNVRSAEFGAEGDGVTNDRAAIMSAAAAAFAAGSGGIFLPLGTYSIGSTIDLTNYPGISIFGEGAGQALDLEQGTIIRPTGDFPAIRLGNTSGITVNHNPVHHYVHDLQIYGTSTGTSQHGIVIAATEAVSYQAAFNVIDRVLIWNCGGDGIQLTDNSWTNTIRNCQIYNNDGNGITALDESNTNLVIACQINNNGGDGIYLEGETGRGIYGFDLVSVESNANTGFGINVSNEYCYGVNIMGCYVENNQSGQLNNAGNSTTVSGGRWMQQAASVVEATTDIITWSGKYGGMWGGWLQYDCRYAINLANSDRATFMGVGLDVNSGGGAFLDYYNLNGASGYIINNQNNRLTVPNLLATGAASPKISAIDTTNNLESVLIAGDTEGLVGAATNHAFYFVTNNTRRMTIDATGKVGIGVVPSTLLHLSDATTPTLRVTDTTTPLSVDLSSGDTEGLIGTSTNHAFYVQTAGTRRMTVDAAKNVVYVGDSSNANMTAGLTLNQGAADDSILAIKSSDVAHGMTDLAETDTYFNVQKLGAATGGAQLAGYSSGTRGFHIQARHTTDNTTKTTAADGTFVVDGQLKSSATVGSLGADANIVVFRNNGSAQFIFDAEGSAHANTEWTTFDTHDDLELLNLLTAHLTPANDPLKANFGEWLMQSKDELTRLKLVTFNEDGNHFINLTRLNMLLVGATRQMGERMAQLEQKLLTISAGA
jgi:hypothetical protein